MSLPDPAPDGSTLLEDPSVAQLRAAFERAGRAAGLTPAAAADRAAFFASGVGYGSYGNGGDDHVSYAFTTRAGRRTVRVFPKSRRSLIRPLIEALVRAPRPGARPSP